jgi:hypothetical protein
LVVHMFAFLSFRQGVNIWLRFDGQMFHNLCLILIVLGILGLPLLR